MPSNIALQILGPALLSAFLWVLHCRRRATAFENLRGPPAKSWLSGSVDQLYNKTAWAFHREISETYGGIARVKGLFGANGLYVYDSKAMYHILVKDQYVYEETDTYFQCNKIVFGEGLLTTIGERHRHQRKMLNPAFSATHLREMVPTFYEVCHKVRDTLVKMTTTGPKEVDIAEWNTRLALELVGQSGLGFTFDSLDENSDPHPFATAAKQMIPLYGETLAIFREWLVPTVIKLVPRRLGRFLVEWVPSEPLGQMRDIVNTFHNTSREIIEAKKKALGEGNEALEAQVGRGKDIISILMKANMEASNEDKLTEQELMGQVTTLTFGATDTTSSALSRVIHLLATHKDYQARAREEIRAAKEENGGQDLGYDALSALPFLDAICRESLRLYAPVPIIYRVAGADIILPLATPVKGISGEDIHEIPVPKGTPLWLSIISSNTDPRMWGPDSYEWKPERWLSPLPEAVVNAHIPGVYSHLLTFMGGGRSCIGFKFSQLEMKVTLALFLERLEFSLADKEVVWHMSVVVAPHPDFESTIPRLPIVISQAA